MRVYTVQRSVRGCAGSRHSFLKLIGIAAVVGCVGAGVASAQRGPAQVRDIQTFVSCLNTVKRVANATVGDAVKCVPQGCTFVATMSGASAQPACSAGGCQLPRVIFFCGNSANPQHFQPAFTLCTTADHFDNSELGEEVDSLGNLKMADVDLRRGTDFKGITVSQVVSTLTNNKGCVGCHGLAAIQNDGTLISRPFPVNPLLVIDSNVPGLTVSPISPFVRESLADICGCITNSSALAQDPSVDRQALIHLCEMLDAKTSSF